MTFFDNALGILWSLPDGPRRAVYRSLRPRQAVQFREMRSSQNIDGGHSLTQFDETKSIFVHIPKCAGVTIANSLYGKRWAGHLRVLHFQSAFTKSEFDSYFKFAVVRNPWDRVYSAYRFLKDGGLTNSDKAWTAENLVNYKDFGEFVKGWLTKASAETKAHFIPQHRFICAPGAEGHAMDFLGRYERLQEDFDRIKRRMYPGGEGEKIELGSLNRTSPSSISYVEAFTPETRDIVADVYAKDIALLGYRFGEPAPSD